MLVKHQSIIWTNLLWSLHISISAIFMGMEIQYCCINVMQFVWASLSLKISRIQRFSHTICNNIVTHINFICAVAHAYYQHIPAYLHYTTQKHADLPTHTRTRVLLMAQWPPLMRGHPFWEATFTHLGWLLERGLTVYKIFKKFHVGLKFKWGL